LLRPAEAPLRKQHQNQLPALNVAHLSSPLLLCWLKGLPGAAFPCLVSYPPLKARQIFQ